MGFVILEWIFVDYSMVFLFAKTHQEFDLTFGHDIEKSEKKQKRQV